MKQTIEAKIIADSVSPAGVRITTMEWVYPRFIHGEVMTHRVFSRNAMSSRAVPVKNMLKQVLFDPAMPVHWGANQPGMQAKAELAGWRRLAARGLWRLGSVLAVSVAGLMHLAGVHKQVANRVLEPWQWMHTLVTSTEWDNFFELRHHPDAQPEFYALAKRVLTEMEISAPARTGYHVPFISTEERADMQAEEAFKVSAARCARVSYLTHDGKAPSKEADLKLFDRLAGSKPFHASPLEHQAVAMDSLNSEDYSGNLKGWHQFRKDWEFKHVS